MLCSIAIKEVLRRERDLGVGADLERLLTLAELARTGDDFRPLAETMRLVCERVVALTGCQFATVYLAQDDPRDENFEMWGSSGILPEYIGWAKKDHEVPTRMWSPVVLASGSAEPRMVTDVFQRPDLHQLWDGARVQGYRGLGVMPMVARGRVLGTVNIYWRHAHEHDPSEEGLLRAAARLAGVAVETAIIAERRLAATAETARLASRLEEANRELSGLNRAQVELAEALGSSPPDPAEAICSFLADRLQTNVLLVGTDAALRCYAGDPEQRAPMARALTREEIARVTREGVAESGTGRLHRIGKERAVGYLLLSAEPAAAHGGRAVVLRHALALLAFELESEQTDRSVRGIARPGMLHALAHGRMTPYLAGEAAPFLQMSGQPCRMAVTPVPSDLAALSGARRLNRLPPGPDFLAAAAESDCILMLVGDRGSAQIRRSVEQLLENAGQKGATTGVSAAFIDPFALPAAMEQARIAARCAASGGLIMYEDLGLTGELLAHVGSAGAEAFVTRLIGALAASDAERGTALVPSLEAYLRHRGSLRRAATELGIHPNTLQLRLARCSRLTGLDLHDPQQLGLLSVALGWRSLLPRE